MFKSAASVEDQLPVMVGQGAAAHDDLHDVRIELSHFGPSFEDFRTEDRRMPPTRELGVGVVVDHDAVRPPKEHDGDRRTNEKADGGLEALRPVLQWAERARPVMGTDQFRDVAFAQEHDATASNAA